MAERGLYGFAQQNNELFGVIFNDPSDPSFGQDFRHPESLTGSLASLFAEDVSFACALADFLDAGIRQTHFSGSIVENASEPAFWSYAVRVPKINWVFRGFYGHFYQAPPLLTASGPLPQFVGPAKPLDLFLCMASVTKNRSLGGDSLRQGVDPGYTLFRTRRETTFDHSNVGNSDIFFPLTIDGALIRGWELTLRSPRIANRGEIYVTYSNQAAQGERRHYTEG